MGGVACFDEYVTIGICCRHEQVHFPFWDDACVAVGNSLFDGSIQADRASEFLGVWFVVVEDVELVGARYVCPGVYLTTLSCSVLV